YGLSYTNFSYSDLKISSDSMTKNSKINASVTVSNTGRFKGEEVVQLYLRDIVGSIARPMKELKGFEKIELEPGESKTVNFEIDNSLLEFYSYNNIWESEPGKFHLFIGTDSNVSDYKEFYLVD
ncbi:fibronectin type III-like domain-contianing protein, partial [Bacteroidota bacterium]|nr:fibronectin type III-like domain-contianing protein [Bacteroidota bacterium]